MSYKRKMASGFDVLELFINNPDTDFSISDVMRKTPICWVSAKDHILDLKRRDWVVKDGNFFKLNSNYNVFIRKTYNKVK